MHNDVGIPPNGGGEVGVEGHVEGVVTPLTAVLQSASAKVLCSLGREEGGGRGGEERGGELVTHSLKDWHHIHSPPSPWHSRQ